MPLTATTPTSRIPNVWVQSIAPPKAVGPTQADIVAIVGEAIRGPLDLPTWVGSIADFKSQFGGMTPTSVAGVPYSAYPAYLSVRSQGPQDIYMVRVGSSLAATAYKTLLASSSAVCALWAASPGTWASSLTILVTAGNTSTTFNLKVTNDATGEVDTWTNLDAADNAALIAAINASATLVHATQPVVAPPTSAPTMTATGSDGTIPAGAYRFLVTYTNAQGESGPSPESSAVTVSSTNHVALTVPTQTGATGAKLYATAAGGAAGTEVYVATITTLGSSQSVTAFASGGAAPPTGPRTATGTALAATTGAGATSAAPTAGTFTFPSSGVGSGHDGQGSAASRHVGSAGPPATGANSLVGLSDPPNVVLLAQAAGGDTTQWQAQADLAAANGWEAIVTLPAGTAPGTSTTAGTALYAVAQATALLGSASARYVKLAYPWWVLRDDEYYGSNILVAPQGYLAGVTAQVEPHTSAANKPLGGNLVDVELAVSDAVRESLVGATIDVGVRNIPAGGFGFTTDLMLDGANSYEVRMTQLIARALLALGGPYVQVPNTPRTRQRLAGAVTGFLDGLAGREWIPSNDQSPTATATPLAATTAGTRPSSVAQTPSAAPAPAGLNYVVVCDNSNNVVGGVTTRSLNCDVQVVLFPNTEAVLFRAQIGQSVVVTLGGASGA